MKNKLIINKLNIKKKVVTGIAIAVCAAGLLGCGKDDESALSKGYGCVVSQEYASALNYFDNAISEGTDPELAYRGKGLAYMGRQEYGRAVSAFKTALTYAGLFPGDVEVDINYYLATCYYKLGEYDNALSVYDAIIDLKPKDAVSYYRRGTLKLNLNDTDGAVADFDKAVELTRSKQNKFTLELDIYSEMVKAGQSGPGETYLQHVLSEGSINDLTDYDKGRLSFYQGEYNQAINYLERARKNSDASIEVISLLADCYKLTDQYDYASVIYNTFLSKEENPEVYNKLGLCYVEQGDYASALQAFESGIAIKDNNTCLQTLYLNEIACYEYLHQYSAAREKLEAYLEVYPSNSTLEKELAFLKTR